MQLSIVIICWNDLKVIKDCLDSVYNHTRETRFEVIVSDNGSTDGALEWIRANHPQTVIIENGQNLGFARANNVGIRAAQGKYVLILNPDTIIHDQALDQWIRFADQHPEAGGFGCKVLNKDGTYQHPAKPFPNVWRYFIAATGLRPLGYLSRLFLSDAYLGWAGETVRPIDWMYGCSLLVRADLLKRLNGFDERFFYNFEEVDLCRRIWDSGTSIFHCPDAVITHLGGQSTGRFPIRFAIEKYRNRYRYIHKHFGMASTRRCRFVAVLGLWIRLLGYGIRAIFRPSEILANRLEMYRVLLRWNRLLDPVKFIEQGLEPDVGYEPLAPAPKIVDLPTT